MKKGIKKDNCQKGAASVVLTLLILSVLLSISFGINSLMIGQIIASRQSGESVIALYAADAGAERCLYQVRKEGASSCPYTDVALDFNSSAKYTTTYNGSDTVTSAGQFNNTSRKIEITW